MPHMIFLSDANPHEAARLQFREARENFRHEHAQCFQPVVMRDEHHDGDGQCGQILLILEVLICGEKHVESGSGKRQEFTVFHARPAAFNDGRHIMAEQLGRRRRGKDSSSRMRIRRDSKTGLLQGCN